MANPNDYIYCMECGATAKITSRWCNGDSPITHLRIECPNEHVIEATKEHNLKPVRCPRCGKMKYSELDIKAITEDWGYCLMCDHIDGDL